MFNLKWNTIFKNNNIFSITPHSVKHKNISILWVSDFHFTQFDCNTEEVCNSNCSTWQKTLTYLNNYNPNVEEN